VNAQGSLEPQGPLAQGQGRLGLALPWRGTRGEDPIDGSMAMVVSGARWGLGLTQNWRFVHVSSSLMVTIWL